MNWLFEHALALLTRATVRNTWLRPQLRLGSSRHTRNVVPGLLFGDEQLVDDSYRSFKTVVEVAHDAVTI